MRRLALSLAAVLAGLLLAAPLASAQIAIDKGIAGARLNNTKAEVHAALGTPTSKRTGTNDFGSFLQESYRGGITVFYQGAKRVTSVATTGLGDRTTRGVGVGSTEATVKARVSGVTCETVVGIRSCHTNDFTPGQRVTDFLIKNGKVTRVSVGFVID
ncbi:MAG: hypothetical protein WBC33_12945 [Conexibacter sp.]